MFWKLLIFIGVLIVSLALVGVIPFYLVAVGAVLIVAGLYLRARDQDWARFNQRQTDRLIRKEPRFASMPSDEELRRTWNPGNVLPRRNRRWHMPEEILPAR